MNNKILITGITGNVGKEVAKILQSQGIPIKAAVRNVSKAQEVFGSSMEFVPFDFEDPTTFPGALEGVSRIFLVRPPAISDTKKYIKPFIEAARDCGIEQIVFLSLMGIENNPIPPHYKIEKYIKASGIPFTFLRPSFFLQNLDTTHCTDIKEKNDIFIPAGKAKVSFIDVRDIGAAAAKVLTEAGHGFKAYTLTGGESLNYYEVAEIFSSTLGRKITYSNPSSLSFRKEMIHRGTPKEFANVMVGLYLSTKLGMASKVTSDLESLLNRKAITTMEYVQDYAQCWK